MTEPWERDEVVEMAENAVWAERGGHLGDARRTARAVLEVVGPMLGGDKYHSLDELYGYRMAYNALAANAMPERCAKSWRHSDGELCFGGGWFVVVMDLSTGQVSNHYKAEHWGLFRVPEAETAPEWDGHTPEVALQRLLACLPTDTKGEPTLTVEKLAKDVV